MDRNALLKKDRLRYTKNKASANLAYLAILFDVLYFVSIYSSDSGKYYYSITIGISVVYNLLFLLFTFLASEGLKNYKAKFSVIIMVIGTLQFVRILGIPLKAHSTLVGETTDYVMGQKQFVYVVLMLCLSAACCIVSGIIGLIRTRALDVHNHKIESGEIKIEYNK